MALAARARSTTVAGGKLQKIEALLGGSRVLARRLTSVLDAHELLLHGLPASALDHLVGNLVVIGKNESLEKAVGMSLRTWQRRKDALSKPLSQEQSGRAWKFAEILAQADIVVVAAPDLTSLRNAKNIIELIKAARPNDTPPRLVINQVGMPKRPEIPAKDFAETMGMEPAAIISFEPALFGQAANNGQMVMEVAPKAAVSDSVRGLCRSLTGRSASASTGVATSILSFLKGRKSA